MSYDAPHRRLILLGLLALGGCGFAPVYGGGGGLRGAVALDTPATLSGFYLRDRLEQRLGTTDAPAFRLRTEITDERRSLAITTSGTNTRFNLVGTAVWMLSDAATGADIANGQVQTFTSYAATGSTTATQAAERDATVRLSVALADLIIARLLLAKPGLPR